MYNNWPTKISVPILSEGTVVSTERVGLTMEAEPANKTQIAVIDEFLLTCHFLQTVSEMDWGDWPPQFR